ncbi:MAG: tetratricopeptide repeat protein [Candidatus Kryptonium sp.]
MKRLLLILLVMTHIFAFSQNNKAQRISQAEFHIANGDLNKAIEIYNSLFKSEPNDLKIAKRLAELYLWTGNLQGASDVYETLLKNGFTDYDILTSLGQWYLWSGRQNDAIKIYENLIKLYPDSVNFYRTLANLYIWNNRSSDAIPLYEKIIEHNPWDYETIAHLAQQYVWNNQQLKAIPLYQKLTIMFPDSLSYHWLLCQLLIWNNKTKEAKRELKRFLRKNPDHRDALELAMQLHYYSGEWDEAKNYAIKLIQIEPRNQTAEKILNEIKTHYSSYTVGEVRWFNDTNKLTRITYPFEARIFINRFWDVNFNLERVDIIDGRINERSNGFGGGFNLRYNFSRGNYFEVGGGGFKYGTQNFPVWRFALGLNAFDRIYPQFVYRRIENREGVKAIEGKIRIDNFTVTVYNQIFNMLGLSFLFDYGIYSDGNIKRTFGSYLNLFISRENPKLFIVGFYAFEDFDSIYANSIPYWTPNELSTYWGEVNIEQSLFKRFVVGVAGAVAKNPGYPTSLNYRVYGKLELFRFELYGQYEKYGSSVYNYRFFRFYAKFRI